MTKRSTPFTPVSEEQVDDAIQRIFGVEDRETLDAMQVRSFPPFALDMAVKLIDGDIGGLNIAAMYEPWDKEEQKRRGAGGRPPLITRRSMLILKLMHAIAYDKLNKLTMAGTLYYLSADDRKKIGLPARELTQGQWYNRIESAESAMLESIDSFPMPPDWSQSRSDIAPKDRINRHRRQSGENRIKIAEYHAANPELVAERQGRLDDLVFELNANFIRHVMSEGLLDGYTGDVAIDGTLAVVPGRGSDRDLSVRAASTNLEAGTWSRHGNHSGELRDEARAKKGLPKGTYRFGHEADVVSMTVGTADMPDLLLAVNVHRPGSTTNVASTLFPRIARLGLPTRNISADRAYNNLRPENFHEVLLQHGYEFVFDYPSDELGVQEKFHANGVGYLMVEGTWYLATMPDDLINCVIRSRLHPSNPSHVDDEALRRLLKAREDYQLKRFGARDAQGFQRYQLPNPEDYIAFDADTGELLAPPSVKTVTIPGKVGLRWAQKFPYLSDAWTKGYHLRSTVERANNALKHSGFIALNDPTKRPGRGYASSALDIAMLTVAHNVRTVDNYLRAKEGLVDPKDRRRKRKARRHADDVIHAVAKQQDSRKTA